MLTLKKKFFFNDANIDRSDPVQLHLLFSQVSRVLCAPKRRRTQKKNDSFVRRQCQAAIVSGTYPTQRTEAKDLAALQVRETEANACIIARREPRRPTTDSPSDAPSLRLAVPNSRAGL